MRTRTLWTVTGALTLSLVLLACGGQEPVDEEVESIQEALELSDSGGYEMTDELPRFGLPELDDLELAGDLELPAMPEEMDSLAGVLPPDPNKLPPPPPCPHGLLMGAWKPLKPGLGVFHGKWAGAGGMVVGHLKGIYGTNKAGMKVFFGKYISKTGKFLGLLKGRYGKGFFKGRWFDKNGLGGVLMGAYGKAKCVTAPDGSEKCLPGAGHFVGKWVAHCPLCNVSCQPGHVNPPGTCICVPATVIPCKQGQCPQGMFCDPCPVLPGCQPGAPCAAVCAPPICKPLPPQPPQQPAAPAPEAPDNSAGID